MSLGKLSKPKSRRYSSDEQYRFIIHTILDDAEGAFNYLSGNQPDGFKIESPKPLNASLIDQNHTATFEGASGFIIRPTGGAANILGTWPGDVGIDMQTESRFNMTGTKLLSATKQGEYNQVHLGGGKIEGVFIRVAAETGRELGFLQTNKVLRKLAARHNLPVAEIAVCPRPIAKAQPIIKEPIDTGSSELYRIVLPENDYEYRIDVVKQIGGDTISFVDTRGFAMRMAKVDGYDVWDRKLTTSDFTTIQQSLDLIRHTNPEIVRYVKQQISEP